MSQVYLELGSRIKALRDHYGLNRSKFAAKVGTSGTTIKNLEEGDTKDPSTSLLSSIAQTCKSTLDWLQYGLGEMIVEDQTGNISISNLKGRDFNAQAGNGNSAVQPGIQYEVELIRYREKVASLERLLAEKDERITELKERIEELKSRLA